ncbi:hypothetical protein EYZ11_003912 [Aspergillus tanneri]|uniref:Uncharacterized protein n=1 Tax=Aspergillus tanneri TaxID=1220188 RepID=A0A4S3JMH2_9EURO|nr:hypothetical protein EYZ11_003912 [Aspergillus tanneri]
MDIRSRIEENPLLETSAAPLTPLRYATSTAFVEIPMKEVEE